MAAIDEEGNFERDASVDGKSVQLFKCGVTWSLRLRSFILRKAS